LAWQVRLPIDEIIICSPLDPSLRRQNYAENAASSAFLRSIADDLATKRTLTLFHWYLEFPDVFYSEDGQMFDSPGFDAVLETRLHLTSYNGR
jgi:hypothetical protein